MRRRFIAAAVCCAGLAACDAAPAAPDSENYDKPAIAAAEHSDSVKVIMLGDSITAGFGLSADNALPVKLQEALRGDDMSVEIINAGVSGDTAADARARLDWVLGERADAIFVALGGNDLLQGIDPAETEANLRAIIETARARGLKVALAGMRAPGNYGKDYRRAFDAIYPRLAREYNVPLYPFLLEDVAARPELNQRDGIHPNETGVEIIVASLAPFLKQNVLSQNAREK